MARREHTAARIQEFHYPVPSGAIVVMFSDGLATQWDLKAYPGLQQRSASVIAGVLYRDFSRRRDDVTVVVARERHAGCRKAVADFRKAGLAPHPDRPAGGNCL